jgi:hypothetical protein
MKRLFIAVAMLLFTGSLWAQQKMNMDDYIQLIRSDLSTTKKDIITKNMEFSEAESKAFWPIYDKYEADLKKIGDAKVQVIKEYSKYYELGTLLPTVAEDLSRRSFKAQKDTIALREKYYSQFKKALSAPKVTRFFQIDNKFQAVVDIQLAAEIPLAK